MQMYSAQLRDSRSEVSVGHNDTSDLPLNCIRQTEEKSHHKHDSSVQDKDKLDDTASVTGNMLIRGACMTKWSRQTPLTLRGSWSSMTES